MRTVFESRRASGMNAILSLFPTLLQTMNKGEANHEIRLHLIAIKAYSYYTLGKRRERETEEEERE